MTRWAKEYGSIYKFSLFGNVNVVLSDPDFMKEVMRTKVRPDRKTLKRCRPCSVVVASFDCYIACLRHTTLGTLLFLWNIVARWFVVSMVSPFAKAACLPACLLHDVARNDAS